MQSQNAQIKKYLKSGKSLTALQALKKFQCFRLASRINDLKNEGFPIRKETIKVNGKRIARYWRG